MQRNVSTANLELKRSCPKNVVVVPLGGKKSSGFIYPAPVELCIAMIWAPIIHNILHTFNPSKQAVSGRWWVKRFRWALASHADQNDCALLSFCPLLELDGEEDSVKFELLCWKPFVNIFKPLSCSRSSPEFGSDGENSLLLHSVFIRLPRFLLR